MHFVRNLKMKSACFSENAGLYPGNQTVVWFYVNQNDVRADPADAAPGDAVILLPAKQTQITASSRHGDAEDLSFGALDRHIGDIAQPAAVRKADDLLAAKLGKADGHK